MTSQPAAGQHNEGYLLGFSFTLLLAQPSRAMTDMRRAS